MSRESKAQKKMAKKYTESVADSYDESARTITDAEAHRDVVYELPSKFRQIMECFMIQMKRYTRQKVVWIALVLLLLIPILFFLFEKTDSGMLPSTDVTNMYIASLLEFMPLVVPFLAAITCGSMISQEFNERTVYLSLPLPMSRDAFYIGKFLAGLILIEGVTIAAYGVSMILAMTVTTKTYTPMIAKSMLMMMAYVFFCCSITYALSTKLRRGSTMLPFALLTLILPIVGLMLTNYVDAGWAVTVASAIPCFVPDLAMTTLGDALPISVYGIAKAIGQESIFDVDCSFGTAFVVSIVLGAILLYVGSRVVKGRDM